MQKKAKPKKTGGAASIQADIEPRRFAELRELFANEDKDKTGGAAQRRTTQEAPVNNTTENITSLMLPDGNPPMAAAGEAIELAGLMFEKIHEYAGNSHVDLRSPYSAEHDGLGIAQWLEKLGGLCFALHVCVEDAIDGMDHNLPTIEAIAAAGDTLKALACLSLRIEPYHAATGLEERAAPFAPQDIASIPRLTPQDLA